MNHTAAWHRWWAQFPRSPEPGPQDREPCDQHDECYIIDGVHFSPTIQWPPEPDGPVPCDEHGDTLVCYVIDGTHFDMRLEV